MPNKSVAREEEILKNWQENSIFKKTLEQAAPKGNFVFYEGPPTANAAPGVHHVLARSFKDVIPRFRTMQGYHVERKAGWDTHGLPVELQVEKKLGLQSKLEIENIVAEDPRESIIKFNAECKDMVWQFKQDWEKMTDRIAYWVDMEDPYITYQAGYIESVWNVIKKADERGLLYQGHKVVPFCTRCGTALSTHEVAQGYKSVTEDSIYVKFKVTQGKGPVQNGDNILSWTTTPWTLPGNVGLAVGEKITYVRIKLNEEVFVIAKELAEKVLEGQGEVIEEFNGKDFIGTTYEPLFPDAVEVGNAKAFEVVPASFVTTTDGTGVVHTAVMYGEDDYNLGEQVGLPKQHTVDLQGKFIDSVQGLAGMYVKAEKTQEKIYELLGDKLFKNVKYKHDYPYCWRCDTPLLYYAKDSWMIAMTKLQKELKKNAEQISWVPAHIKIGRFGEWIEGIKDWAISRERYWGTPLPVWKCDSCDTFEVVGSFDQLTKRAKKRNTFIFVRHGESVKNVERLMNSDIEESKKYPLTKNGEADAKKVAKELKKLGVTKIYSSPLLRTKQTAEIIASENDLEVEENVGLREYGSPKKYEGTSVDVFNAEVLVSGKPAPEGIEKRTEAARRMLKVISELDHEHEGEVIVLVSHGDPILFALAAVQGYELETVKTRKLIEYPKTSNARIIHVATELISPEGEYNPHRPYVDGVAMECKCGGKMNRTPEVLDVWFDSGSMPFSQYHYPFEHKELVDKKNQQFPAEYICEAIDQTRGWFYTLLAISTIMEKGTSFKNVICLGHINDAKGKKMSKSKGNIVDPWSVINEHGADALRWYLYTINQPGDTKNFDLKGVAEASRKPLMLLENVLSFYKLYENQHQVGEVKPVHLMDKWIVARLQQLIEFSTTNLEQYQITETARAIGDFVNDLSTWYVRRSRDRFRAADTGAVATLGYVLQETAKLLAPLTPFAAEFVYSELNLKDKKESVHLETWPEYNKKLHDEKVLEEMTQVTKIVEQGLAARAEAKIKVRQPLQRYSTALVNKLDEAFVEILQDELNVKEIGFGKDELDTQISETLKLEGQARELIRQINQLRKTSKLTIQDRVVLYVTGFDDVMDAHGEEIAQSTLADSIEKAEGPGMQEVEGGKIGIKKL